MTTGEKPKLRGFSSVVKRNKQNKEYTDNKLLEIQTICCCNKHFMTYFRESNQQTCHHIPQWNDSRWPFFARKQPKKKTKNKKKTRSVLQAIISAKMRAFPGGCIFLRQQLNYILSFAPENNCAFDSCLHEWCQTFHIFSWLTKVANRPVALFLPQNEPSVLSFSEKIISEIMHVVSARWFAGPFKVTCQFLLYPTL